MSPSSLLRQHSCKFGNWSTSCSVVCWNSVKSGNWGSKSDLVRKKRLLFSRSSRRVFVHPSRKVRPGEPWSKLMRMAIEFGPGKLEIQKVLSRVLERQGPHGPRPPDEHAGDVYGGRPSALQPRCFLDRRNLAVCCRPRGALADLGQIPNQGSRALIIQRTCRDSC